jgi:hypothetical protein
MTDFLWSALAWLRWLTLETSYLSLETRYWLGFLVALGCFLLVTLWFVREVSGKGGDARLFTVLALFAGVWALTASIYEIQDANPYARKPISGADFRPRDVAGDLASFLMVFVGALVAREGTEAKRFFNTTRLQILALILLGALVVPTQAAPRIGLGATSSEVTEIVIAGALGLVGFAALGVGSQAIAQARHYRWLVGILSAYALLVIARHAQLLALYPGREPMSDFMVLGFALAKVLLTATFGHIVVDHHMRNPAKHAP